MFKRSIPASVALAAVLVLAAGCDSNPSASEDAAFVKILLTDAPADYIAEAWVEIPRVYFIPGEEEPEEGPPFVDLFNDPDNPLSYDLLTLRDGVTADLTGEVEVPAGQYNQLRMIVGRAEITLRDGYQFADGSQTRSLFIPSGAQTGIKVNLAEPVTTEGGTINVILVDFDVDQNFVIQGNPETPAGIQGILFTPMLRELSRNVEDA
jgi:hypothetical protein